jgi:hypothetical protein
MWSRTLTTGRTGEGAGMGKGTLWGMIDAQPIYFPAVVDELNAATLVFPVPAEAARAHVPEGDFEVVESQPGVAYLIITAHDYIRGEWGTCETLDLGFRVRPVGAPDETTGLYLCPSPMRPGLSREAAHRALGFPKTDGEIHVRYTDGEVTFTHTVDERDGAPDIVLRLPRIRPAAQPGPVAVVAYTYADGEPKMAPFTLTPRRCATWGCPATPTWRCGPSRRRPCSTCRRRSGRCGRPARPLPGPRAGRCGDPVPQPDPGHGAQGNSRLSGRLAGSSSPRARRSA